MPMTDGLVPRQFVGNSDGNHSNNFHDDCFRPSLGLLQTQAYSALVKSRRCYEIGRNLLLDRQPDPGLTGAHGLIATIPGPNAENREAVCSQSRCSFPSADGQTEDARHEEQREQLAAPTIPPGGIFYRR